MSEKTENVNIREIARQAGVSVASVSRALQESPSKKISAELRTKILQICDEQQYYPNMHTVRMLKNRSNTIALLAPPECIHVESEYDYIDYNLAGVIGGVEKFLSGHSMYVTIASMTGNFIANKEYLKFSRGKMVDGFIAWGLTSRDEFIYELIAEGAPLVAVQGGFGRITGSQVNARDYEGMGRIVEYIVSQGHRRIAYIPALETSFSGVERNRGFTDAMSQAGLAPFLVTEETGFNPDVGYAAATRIFKKKLKPTCIVAANDYVALGVIKAAGEFHLRIPEDISLTGADGLMLPAQFQLTTYLSPSFQLGVAGAEMLCRIIDNPAMPPENARLPVRFVQGMTVAQI